MQCAALLRAIGDHAARRTLPRTHRAHTHTGASASSRTHARTHTHTRTHTRTHTHTQQSGVVKAIEMCGSMLVRTRAGKRASIPAHVRAHAQHPIQRVFRRAGGGVGEGRERGCASFEREKEGKGRSGFRRRERGTREVGVLSCVERGPRASQGLAG